MQNPLRIITTVILLALLTSCTSLNSPTTVIMGRCLECGRPTLQDLISEKADVNFRDDTTLGQTPLIWSILLGNIATIHSLIDLGADPNMTNNNSFSPLFQAVKMNNHKIVDLLIGSGADPNMTNNNRVSPPLFQAVKMNNHKIVDLLIGSGADVNQKSVRGQNPFEQSISLENITIIRSLINAGVDVNQIYNAYTADTPLLDAIRKRNDTIVQLLLDNGANPNQKNRDGYTPLEIAINRSSDTIVQLLLDNGADLNQENRYGSTPLRIAIMRNSDTLVQLLLDNGANPNQENSFGQTPLETAERIGYEKTLQILNRYNPERKLIFAIKNNHSPGVIQTILDDILDVNFQHNSNQTPLITAIENNSLEIVQLLIKNGADINFQNKIEEDPLLVAIKTVQNENIIQLLLDAGADQNRTLMLAIQYGHNPRLIEYLSNNGIDVNARDSYGKTPLMRAIYYDNPTIIQTLLDTGAKIDARTEDGSTALMLAANNGNSVATQTLLDNGANVHTRNEKGETALLVSKHATSEVMQILLNNGANINDQDVLGNTMFDRIFGTPEEVEFLINAGIDIEMRTNCRQGNDSLDCSDYHSTPLIMIATSFYTEKQKEAVEMLVEAGADIEARDSLDRTPLMYTFENYETTKYLIESGANVNVTDFKGWTPLMFVARSANYLPESIGTLLLTSGADASIKNKDGKTAWDLLPENLENKNDFFWALNDLRLAEQSMKKQDKLTPVPESIPKKPLDIVASGTGFFISPDGYLITNHHVVAAAQEIKIVYKFETFTAKLLQSDKTMDLALLKVDLPDLVPYLPLGFSRGRIGEEVFTVGFPLPALQGQDVKFTEGSISATSGVGDDSRFFQISVPVQPGNSGGPLLNFQGEVVGVVTSRLSYQAAFAISGTLPQNINYALKGLNVLNFVDEEVLPIRKNPGTQPSRREVIDLATAAVVTVFAY